MSTEMFSVAGRRAAVTGAGRGIGRALALGLADAGADLLLLGRPSDGLRDTAAQVTERGRRAVVHEVDLSEPREAEAVGARLAAETPADILVNNAGVIERHDAIEIPAESWQHVLDVNLTSLFHLTRQLAGPMLGQRAGKIINIASLLSFQGGVKVASYAASKHAVAGLTRALANEWASHGITVNAVAPGYIETDNTEALRNDPERLQAINARIPAGRWGRPADLVGAVLFLASPASDYVNGHVLVVDGGWTAR